MTNRFVWDAGDLVVLTPIKEVGTASSGDHNHPGNPGHVGGSKPSGGGDGSIEKFFKDMPSPPGKIHSWTGTLYHATSHDAAGNILSSGFDLSRSGENGDLYGGNAIYFSMFPEEIGRYGPAVIAADANDLKLLKMSETEYMEWRDAIVNHIWRGPIQSHDTTSDLYKRYSYKPSYGPESIDTDKLRDDLQQYAIEKSGADGMYIPDALVPSTVVMYKDKLPKRYSEDNSDPELDEAETKKDSPAWMSKLTNIRKILPIVRADVTKD